MCARNSTLTISRRDLNGPVNSNEMLMAWPNRTEEAIPPWFYNFQVGADNIRAGQIGARSIRYTLSHDGGHTWDPVSNMSLPDVLTRTGVSCGWNPGRSAFVLAWQSATTDNVEFAESIPFGWRRLNFGLPAIPAGALRPSTHDSPQLYYDPFGDGVGVLVWQDKNDLTTRHAQVFFDPTTSWYRIGSATSLDACPPGDCSLNLHHRSLLTPAVIDGAFHETWSLASVSGTDGVQYLSRKRHSGFLPAVLAESSNYIITPGSLSPLPVYQQFAEDRLFVRRALLETQIGSVE